jgi:hypothetical protein
VQNASDDDGSRLPRHTFILKRINTATRLRFTVSSLTPMHRSGDLHVRFDERGVETEL